jgi:type VI secretion system VasI family protein
MKTGVQSALLMLLIGGPALGADVPAARLQACAALQQTAQRLECFDGLVSASSVAPVAGGAAQGGGKWLVSEDVDSLTSQVRITAILQSENSVAGRFGRSNYAALAIACRSNKTDVFVNVRDFVSTSDVPVLTRVDENPPVTRSWSVSTNYQSVFSRQAVALAQELEGAGRFQLRVTPHGESPRSFDFDVRGLNVHLPKIRAACGW